MEPPPIKMYFHSGKESTEPTEKKLDEIIKFAKTFDDRRFSSTLLNNEFIVDGKFPLTLNLLMEYLIDEGMIGVSSGKENTVSVSFFQLKVKGEIFEGFVNRKTRLQREKLIQSLPIWVTAIGTGISGLYFLAKFFLWMLGY